MYNQGIVELTTHNIHCMKIKKLPCCENPEDTTAIVLKFFGNSISKVACIVNSMYSSIYGHVVFHKKCVEIFYKTDCIELDRLNFRLNFNILEIGRVDRNFLQLSL